MQFLPKLKRLYAVAIILIAAGACSRTSPNIEIAAQDPDQSGGKLLKNNDDPIFENNLLPPYTPGDTFDPTDPGDPGATPKPTLPPGPDDPSYEFPHLEKDGTKLVGAGLIKQKSLIGVNHITALTDDSISADQFRETLCMLKNDYKLNFLKVTTHHPGEGSSDFVSVFDDEDKWISRRDALIEAGLACKVYIGLVLFGEPDKTEYQPRSKNPWNGRTPSLALAKELAEKYYLKGISPSSKQGKVLVVQNIDDNVDEDSVWTKETDEGFGAWLKSKGYFTIGKYKADGSSDVTWKTGDMLEYTAKEDRPNFSNDEELVIKLGKIPFLQWGNAQDQISESDAKQLALDRVRLGYSMEIAISDIPIFSYNDDISSGDKRILDAVLLGLKAGILAAGGN